MTRLQRAEIALRELDRLYPSPAPALKFKDAFTFLVAVVLSAQCTDRRVNLVTPALFAAYPTPQAMAQASEDDIFQYIHSVSYPHNKSRHLVGLARMLASDFGGEVPSDIDLLQRLPGVGRKTANVVAAVVFDLPAMPVDTHVFRVAHRIGLVRRATTPLAVERQLVKHIPAEKLAIAHHWLILHGRYVCQARQPRCSDCGIRQLCVQFDKKKGASA